MKDTIKNKFSTYIHRFLENWTYPTILFLSTLFLFHISQFTGMHYLQKTAVVLICIGTLLLLISVIYHFSRKHWKDGFVMISIFIGGVVISVILVFIVSVAIPMIDGDHWADDLKIPDGIQIENPRDLKRNKRPDSIVSLQKRTMDLILYNAGQPGMYEYDFWVSNLEDGEVYLKAFEITQEYRLSQDQLDKYSIVYVHNPTDSIKRFSLNSYFTIYEGDWGDYYAARFEVWFKPTNGNKERKLFQKKFKIEGWMH